MVDVVFVEPDGTRHGVYAREGVTAMEAAVRNGVPGIVAECGGACACATCHVLVDPAWTELVGPPNAMEESLLDLVGDPPPNARLSCQIKIRAALDGLILHLPEEQF